MKKFLMSVGLCLMVQLNAVASSDVQTATNYPPVNDPDAVKFVEVVEAANLRKLFQGSGPFTFFIPSNASLDRFGADKIQELEKPANKDTFTKLVLYHVVPGLYPSKNLKTKELPTLNGKKINVVVDNDQITVNNIKVIKKDIQSANGVVYIIDGVLTPPQ